MEEKVLECGPRIHSELFLHPWLFPLGLNGSFSRAEVVIEVFLIFNFIMFISTVPVKEQHVPSLCSLSPWLITLCCFGSFGKRYRSFGNDSWCNSQTSALSVTSEERR